LQHCIFTAPRCPLIHNGTPFTANGSAAGPVCVVRNNEGDNETDDNELREGEEDKNERPEKKSITTFYINNSSIFDVLLVCVTFNFW
jgi:hypothetical protein